MPNNQSFTLCYEAINGSGYDYGSLDRTDVSSSDDLLQQAQSPDKTPQGMRLVRINYHGGLPQTQQIWSQSGWVPDVRSDAFPEERA